MYIEAFRETASALLTKTEGVAKFHLRGIDERSRVPNTPVGDGEVKG
jgi:hypothetical protein